MVWIHGGGYVAGGTVIYPADLMVPVAEVIVVTIQYRLGAFAFFAVPEFSDLNVGLIDQQFAMKWVKNNIQNFGGDHNRITIFGQSAGGTSVAAHLIIPGSWDYYQNAILQSPAMWNYVSKEFAIAAGIKWAESVGCSTPNRLTCLQALNVSTVNLAPGYYGPCIDGKLFTESPIISITKGNFNKQGLLVLGSVLCEGCIGTWSTFGEWAHPPTEPLPDSLYYAAMQKQWKNNATKVESWYEPIRASEGNWRAYAQMSGDSSIICDTYWISFLLAAHKTLYRYWFIHDPQVWNRTFLNATHTGEVPFVFYNPVKVASNWLGYSGFTPAEYDFAKQMVKLWASVAYGDISRSGIEWTPFSLPQNTTLVLDLNIRLESIHWPYCNYWALS